MNKEKEVYFQTIPEVLQKTVKKWPNRTAIRFKGESITYRELSEKVNRLTKGLKAIGIKKGDHVATFIGGHPEWFTVSYALTTIGAVIVPVNVTLQKEEIMYVLQTSDISTIILQDEYRDTSFIELISEAITELKESFPGYLRTEKLPNLRNVITISENDNAYEGCFNYRDILQSGIHYTDAEINHLIEQIKPEDPSYILYTSGSTAFPKPVIRSHGSNVGIAHYMSPEMDENSVMLGQLPFYHIAGCVYITLGTALKGASVVLMEFFDPTEALRLIETEKITTLGGFDTHFQYILGHPLFKETDISSVKKIILAGGPEWYTKLKRSGFKHAEIAHHYGFTEGTGVAMEYSVIDENIRKYSNGKPFPGVDLKIVDHESRETLSANTAGEICLRGWTLFKGYYKSPKATAEVLNEDGFFYTGDYGWLDEEGFLYYRGRYKGMVKTGGENVSELEVEMFLQGHDDIKVVQVVGIPDSKWGEAVTAIVETHSSQPLSIEGLKSFCENEISDIKIPKYVVNVKASDWPITPTGKYDKNKLRELAVKRLNQKVN